MSKGYKSKPLSFTRQMVIASLRSNKRNAIHCLTEIDISTPRTLIRDHYDRTGNKISFTAYIVKCFAEAIRKFPEMNSFIKGRKLILLDDITISVLIEREIDGIKVPEPVGIQKVQEKSVIQITDEIRSAQNNAGNKMGDLSNITWIRHIPGFLLRTFIRIADKNISMAKRYGKIAVTAVGMHSPSKTWFIPHGTATVLLTIGSINKINTLTDEGQVVSKEILNITASFDHEIIDGAPAARFMKCFEMILTSGDWVNFLNITPYIH